MRLNAFLVLLLVSAAATGAQAQQRYSEVRIVVADRQEAARVGIVAELDHLHAEPTGTGWVVTGVLSMSELAALRAAGYSYEVLVEDSLAQIEIRATTCPLEPPAGSPRRFFYGSLYCFPTFDETVAALDDMRAAFPHLVTHKESIGLSWEGRDIWMVRISAAENPEAVPEALYTSLHHAREPGSLASVLYFMYHLLEGYGSDKEVTYLLDNRALYFIPILNPDGYVFVETDNIMWRKNRRPNDDGSFGVDLNRNYGYAWDCAAGATSCNPSSGLYAGPYPFSEPETQALRQWLQTRNIRGAFNYHTFGSYWLHPFGYTTSSSASKTPHHAHFTALGAEITRHNGYLFGPAGVVLYPFSGSSDDWMYGEHEEKDSILAFTPEMGTSTDNFWPSPARIVPIARDALHANMVLARFVGSYLSEVHAQTASWASSDTPLLPGGELLVALSLLNLGLESAQAVRARVTSTNPALGIEPGPWSTTFEVPPFEQVSAPSLSFPIAAHTPPGEHGGLVVEVHDAGRVLTAALEPVRVGAPSFVLDPPYPNPATEEVEVQFSMEREGQVRIEVLDALGRRLRLLADGYRQAGPHVLSWDGQDDAGRPVATGVYIVLVQTGGKQAAPTVTIIR